MPLQFLRPHDRPESSATPRDDCRGCNGRVERTRAFLSRRTDDRGMEARPPSRSRSNPSASRAERPHRSAADANDTRPSSITRTVGSTQAPVMTMASQPARLAARAKCDDDRASFRRFVRGDLATTANSGRSGQWSADERGSGEKIEAGLQEREDLDTDADIPGASRRSRARHRRGNGVVPSATGESIAKSRASDRPASNDRGNQTRHPPTSAERSRKRSPVGSSCPGSARKARPSRESR